MHLLVRGWFMCCGNAAPQHARACLLCVSKHTRHASSWMCCEQTRFSRRRAEHRNLAHHAGDRKVQSADWHRRLAGPFLSFVSFALIFFLSLPSPTSGLLALHVRVRVYRLLGIHTSADLLEYIQDDPCIPVPSSFSYSCFFCFSVSCVLLSQMRMEACKELPQRV